MKIMSWNVNDIRARKSEIIELLAESQPDIPALQETKKLSKNNRISFPRYEVY